MSRGDTFHLRYQVFQNSRFRNKPLLQSLTTSHRVTFSCLRAVGRTSACPSDAPVLLLVPFWAEKVFTLPFPFCQGALSYTSSLVGFSETTRTPVRCSSLFRHCLGPGESHATIPTFPEAEHAGTSQLSGTYNDHAAPAASHCLKEPRS